MPAINLDKGFEEQRHSDKGAENKAPTSEAGVAHVTVFAPDSPFRRAMAIFAQVASFAAKAGVEADVAKAQQVMQFSKTIGVMQRMHTLQTTDILRKFRRGMERLTAVSSINVPTIEYSQLPRAVREFIQAYKAYEADDPELMHGLIRARSGKRLGTYERRVLRQELPHIWNRWGAEDTLCFWIILSDGLQNMPTPSVPNAYCAS